MQGAGVGVLGDLFAAAEAVADDDGFGVVADGGEKDAFAQFLREVVFFFFEAEGAGHAATAGVEEFDVCSGEAEEGELVVHAHGGAVMAVAVDDDLFVEIAGACSRGRV